MIEAYKGEYFDIFKPIFDDAENGICIVDYDGYFVELNNIFADIFGYQKEDLIGQKYSYILSEDSLPIVEENHKKIFNGTNILKAEEKVRHRNGTLFYIQTTNLKINDDYGNKLRITTVADISSRLRNELVQSVLLKISNLINLTSDSKNLYSSIHQALCQLIPIKNFAVCIKNKISGNFEFPFILNELQIEKEEDIKAEHNFITDVGKAVILNEKKVCKLIEQKVLSAYKITPKSILGIPLTVQKEILGSLIIKDYTEDNFTKQDLEFLELVAGQVARVIERKNYEDELVFARIKAEESAKLKSEFLAQVSHEIRTPLNSILSFSSLIKSELNGALTPELEEAFNYIESGGNRLTRTIDLILNVSKSKNNQYKIILEEIDIEKDLLTPIFNEFRNLAKKKNLALKFLKPKEKLSIVCDLYSVHQLFSNLVENAVKYTADGSITISAFKNEIGKIQIDIEDTGIGISQEYLPKLFEPFSQEEQGYTRSYEGIGLGLSLVKSYTELNSAEIFVKSEKNKGSLFSVIFN
jgi:PAS domain S-box-containing protein